MPQKKECLDWYPVDTGMFDNRKVRLIRGAFPSSERLAVYAVIHLLLDAIYGEKGYYMPWAKQDLIIFADTYNLEQDWLGRIVETCLEERLFDIKVYDKYHVLTSAHVQLNYLDAAHRRYTRRNSQTELVAVYLIENREICDRLVTLSQKIVLVDQNGVLVDEGEFWYAKTQQRRGEDRIGEDIQAPATKTMDLVMLGSEDQVTAWHLFETRYGMHLPEQELQRKAMRDIYAWAEATVSHNGKSAMTATEFVTLMMESMSELKTQDTSKKGFWRDMPYLPAKLWKLKADILEHARGKFRENKQSNRYEELMSKLDQEEA